MRRQCDDLGPLVETALDNASCSGEAAAQLYAIRERLLELEGILSLSHIHSRSVVESAPRVRIHEMSPCIAQAGSETIWRTGRIVLSDAGLSFETQQSLTREKSIQLVPWGDIIRIAAREPAHSSSSGSRHSASSNLYEVELDLKRAPGLLRFQFGAPRPVHRLKNLWNQASASDPEASRDNVTLVPKMVELPEGLQPLVDEMKKGKGLPTTPVRSVHKVELRGRITVAEVYQQMARPDESCVLRRLWETRNITELNTAGWENVEDGLMLCLHFQLPLKPVPLCPPVTRMVVVYHLRFDSPTGGGMILTEMSRSLDVPFGTHFMVQVQRVFSEVQRTAADGQVEEAVEMDTQLGISWNSRLCPVKGVVETQSRSETVEACEDMRRFLEDLGLPAPVEASTASSSVHTASAST